MPIQLNTSYGKNDFDKIRSDLISIGKMAYGSNEGTGGGAGNIGMINGRVVKFNTQTGGHAVSGTTKEMLQSCNELRKKLADMLVTLSTMSNDHTSSVYDCLPESELRKICDKLGFKQVRDENGNLTGMEYSKKSLLDRKTVAAAISVMDNHVNGSDKSQIAGQKGMPGLYDEIKTSIASEAARLGRPVTETKFSQIEKASELLADKIQKMHVTLNDQEKALLIDGLSNFYYAYPSESKGPDCLVKMQEELFSTISGVKTGAEVIDTIFNKIVSVFDELGSKSGSFEPNVGNLESKVKKSASKEAARVHVPKYEEKGTYKNVMKNLFGADVQWIENGGHNLSCHYIATYDALGRSEEMKSISDINKIRSEFITNVNKKFDAIVNYRKMLDQIPEERLDNPQTDDEKLAKDLKEVSKYREKTSNFTRYAALDSNEQIALIELGSRIRNRFEQKFPGIYFDGDCPVADLGTEGSIHTMSVKVYSPEQKKHIEASLNGLITEFRDEAGTVKEGFKTYGMTDVMMFAFQATEHNRPVMVLDFRDKELRNTYGFGQYMIFNENVDTGKHIAGEPLVIGYNGGHYFAVNTASMTVEQKAKLKEMMNAANA